MLVELSVHNFAIIEEAAVSFRPGLNVLSGETGAGKSVVLHALEFILGRRAATHAIRAGAEALEVSALFDLSAVPSEIVAALPDVARAGYPENPELLLSRTLTAAGKNKVHINGRLGTVGLLEEIAGRLINICGQNQQMRLLDPAYHLTLLDGYAGHGELVARYQTAHERWIAARDAVRGAEVRLQSDAERQARLEEIVRELSPLGLRPGLRSDLEAEVKRQSNAENIIAGGQTIAHLCSDEGGALDTLNRIGVEVQRLAVFDPDLDELSRRFHGIRAELSEFENDLGAHMRKVDIDERALELTRERLAEVARLERKYRTHDAGLEAMLKEAEAHLAPAEGVSVERLEAELAMALGAVEGVGRELTRSRERAAAKLARDVGGELAEVAMAGASIKVALHPEEIPGAGGLERAEIIIATNPGEPHKPLKLIASGGELSRLTLILKKVLRDRSGVNILVFDEVDTGISGSVARAVGEKLRELSRDSQVLCITHLPQVASLADAHFLVTKSAPAGKGGAKRAISRVRLLEDGERVDEIARMLAGYDISAAAKESARELLASKTPVPKKG
jgi:DNA repair protein RecN (Recombination protein N)